MVDDPGLPPELADEIEGARSDPKLRFGKLLLVRELGRGGMGVVYLAWQEDLRRVVAVKILPVVDDSELNQRFLREARLSSKLRHPHIVGVHEMGEIDGRAYFTMDCIEGGTLQSALKGHRRPPLRNVVAILRTIAQALDYAHRQGVVHRDVKPANILLDAQGRPFLSDFGLAREVSAKPGLTRTGAMMGTPNYMSPEQVRGARREIGPASDLWALGAVLYEALTGEAPFHRADLLQQCEAILGEEPAPPSSKATGVPRDLDAVVLKCLAKDPRRRYRNAAELADDLDRFLSGKPVQARPPGAWERTIAWARRRALVLAGAAVLLAAAAGAVVMMRQRSGLEAELARLRSELNSATTPEDRARLEREIERRAGSPTPRPPTPVPTAPPAPPTPKPSATPEPGPSATPSPTAAPSRWSGVEARVRDRAGRGDVLGALRELAMFSPESDEDRLRARTEADRLAPEAKAQFDRASAKAAEHEAAGRFPEALAELDPFLNLPLVEVASAARTAREEIEARRSARERESAARALADLRIRVLPIARRRDYAAAVEAAASPEAEDLRRRLQSVREALGRVPAGAAALKGRTFEFDAGPGEIRGASAREVTVYHPAMKAEIGVSYDRVRASAMAEFLRAGGAPAETIGLFLLFEGRPEDARKAWASSPEREALDAFAAAAAADLAEAEAQAALKDLLDASARKDWKRCRELLAQKKRFESSRAWTEAAVQIEDVAIAAAPEVAESVFAIKPRNLRSAMLWSYDWNTPRQLRDWALTPIDRYDGEKLLGEAAYGLRAEKAGNWMRNAELRFVAPLDGPGVLTAEFAVAEEGSGRLGLTVGGYQWLIADGPNSDLANAPSGAKIESKSRKFGLDPGRTFTAELQVSADGVRGLIDGREAFRCKAPEPPRQVPPTVQVYGDTAVIVRGLRLQGRLRKGWESEQKAAMRILGETGRPLPGRPIDASFGPDFKPLFRPPKGKVEIVDGAIKFTSTKRLGEEAHIYSERAFRNVRMKFRFMAHAGRGLEIELRIDADQSGLSFKLPMDRPGVWRTAQIVLVESACLCIVDENLNVGTHFYHDLTPQPGFIRIVANLVEASLRDFSVEEIVGAPEETPWIHLGRRDLSGLKAAKGWMVDRPNNWTRALVGTGELETTESWRDLEVRLGFELAAEGTLRLALRGGEVLNWTCPRTGYHEVRLVARGESFEAWVDDVPLSPPPRILKGPGPIRLAVTGTIRIPQFVVRPY